MQTDYDNDLLSYFTDMELLRGMFKDFVSTEKFPKRLIVFHGVGVQRPDTISPIPEGTTLLEAEKIAREREPGDGTKQISVLQQIEVAL